MNQLPVRSAKRYFFRFNTSEVNAAKKELGALFTPVIEQTKANSVIVYGADRQADEFRAVAARSAIAPRIPELGVTIGEEGTAILRRTTEPFHATRIGDERFANLPECLQYGVRNLLIFPLRAEDHVLGFLTLGRTSEEPFDPASIPAALPVAHVATAILERDALQIALKERKLVERAKGVLQRRRRISEEEAYNLLRSQSRRARRAMAEVAEEILSEAALRKTA
jgi:GAF domain-containing protein